MHNEPREHLDAAEFVAQWREYHAQQIEAWKELAGETKPVIVEAGISQCGSFGWSKDSQGRFYAVRLKKPPQDRI